MGAGYDAKLIHETPAELKKHLGFIGYVMFGIRNAGSVRPVKMELELDEEVKHIRAHTVMVINIGSIQSLGFAFAPDIDPHDGKLNIEIMSTRSLWGSFQIVLRILTRRYHGFPDLKHLKARRVRVTSESPFPVEVDGDPLGTTPFLAEVIHDAMPFLVPANYKRDSYIQNSQ
jgi:diacylglycerol kinase family enzyme